MNIYILMFCAPLCQYLQSPVLCSLIIVVQLIGYVMLLLPPHLWGNSHFYVVFHYISQGTFLFPANEPADSVFLGISVVDAPFCVLLKRRHRVICYRAGRSSLFWMITIDSVGPSYTNRRYYHEFTRTIRTYCTASRLNDVAEL